MGDGLNLNNILCVISYWFGCITVSNGKFYFIFCCTWTQSQNNIYLQTLVCTFHAVDVTGKINLKCIKNRWRRGCVAPKRKLFTFLVKNSMAALLHTRSYTSFHIDVWKTHFNSIWIHLGGYIYKVCFFFYHIYRNKISLFTYIGWAKVQK